MQFAIVVSEFNSIITNALLQGAIEQFKEFGILEDTLFIASVPGAVEIPFTAQRLAKKKQYAAIVCLGAVIKGETDHYDYVCQQVSNGCQQVMLEQDIPIIFGILTTTTVQQAKDRVGGKKGHKGKDAVIAAVKMAKLMQSISV